jgi:hypothetical protein
MPNKSDPALQSLPVSNYDSAVARALEWLGDRYLLAKPINTHVQPPRPAAAVGQRQLNG